MQKTEPLRCSNCNKVLIANITSSDGSGFYKLLDADEQVETAKSFLVPIRCKRCKSKYKIHIGFNEDK